MKTAGVIALLALLVLSGCGRPDPSAGPRLKAELAGGWLRDVRGAPGSVEGFDLREDGSAALIGILSMNAIAWTVSRNELVISTNTDRYPRPNPIRLQIASLEGDLLTLEADPPDYLAGTWRRFAPSRVSGVVTYLEPQALAPDARVEVRLVRGGKLLARTLISPRGPVPIAFTLSYLPGPSPQANEDALEATIFTPDGPIFGSLEPLPISAGAVDVELLVHASRGAG